MNSTNFRARALWMRTFLVGVALGSVVACGASAPPEEGDDAPKKTNTGKGGDGDFGQTGDGDGKDGTPCTPGSGSFDVPGDGCDNDGDGKVDNASSCDDAAEDGSATAFARAIGICDDASKKGYGLVSAAFTQGYSQSAAPKDDQHGVLSKFGNIVKPREGNLLGVLSTGYAKEYNGKGTTPFANGMAWWSGQAHGAPPPGYPKAAGGCSQSKLVTDVSAIKLTLKAPKNAKGIKFDFNFHSSEWPSYICTDYNDAFVAWVGGKAYNGGLAGNISYDSKNNPVSVNNGFFDRCTPGAKVGCSGEHPGTAACSAGASELGGTGFGVEGQGCDLNRKVTMGGATGWLTSQAPIQGGETLTVEFMIWDAGDGNLDSSVLLDNFRWVGDGDVQTTTVRPPN